MLPLFWLYYYFKTTVFDMLWSNDPDSCYEHFRFYTYVIHACILLKLFVQQCLLMQRAEQSKTIQLGYY